jgi:hypothetical protein
VQRLGHALSQPGSVGPGARHRAIRVFYHLVVNVFPSRTAGGNAPLLSTDGGLR